MLLLPIPARQFLAGVLVASGGWAVVMLVQLLSGAAPLSLGETAEYWTANERDTAGRITLMPGGERGG